MSRADRMAVSGWMSRAERVTLSRNESRSGRLPRTEIRVRSRSEGMPRAR